MSETPKEPKVDSTLSKGLAILENLAASQGSKGVTELSRELELTKSNTFRLLQTLNTLGYVKHLDDKTYAATLKTWQVGAQFRRKPESACRGCPRDGVSKSRNGRSYLSCCAGRFECHLY